MTKRAVLVDTQLLVLLIVGSTKPDLIGRHKRTKGTYTRRDYELLLDLLGYAPKFMFCPHVASEVSNLVAQYGEPDRSSLMAVFKALLNNASEVPIASAVAMERPEFITLGLADAAQLALCGPDSVILTDDEPLFRAASVHGMTVLHFADEKQHRRRFLA